MSGDKEWFHVSKLDDNTFIISEPHYWQQNNQYLLIGDKRALLFDSGPGRRDISKVVNKLTDVPVITLGSHAHYDHISGHWRFDQIAMADLKINRDQVQGGSVYRPKLSLRFALFRPRQFHVSEWWPLGEPVDLGNRQVTLIHLPGHTTDSIGLIDRSHGYIFTGDFIQRGGGGVIAGLPTGSVADYNASVQQLLEVYEGERLFGGHFDPFPALGRKALEELLDATQRALEKRSGSQPIWPLTSYRSGDTTFWATRWAFRKSRHNS